MIDGSFQTIIHTHLLADLTKIAQSRFDKHLQRMKQIYQDKRHLLLSSDELETVAKALMEGRVSHLFIEKDHVIPGQLNLNQQKVMHWDLHEPHTDDVLDDMLQLALTKGTAVYILDKSMMPTTQGVAANFRY
jgi:DNA-binding transcriptional MocR family regulator